MHPYAYTVVYVRITFTNTRTWDRILETCGSLLGGSEHVLLADVTSKAGREMEKAPQKAGSQKTSSCFRHWGSDGPLFPHRGLQLRQRWWLVFRGPPGGSLIVLYGVGSPLLVKCRTASGSFQPSGYGKRGRGQWVDVAVGTVAMDTEAPCFLYSDWSCFWDSHHG